jgi:hypothetical protein
MRGIKTLTGLRILAAGHAFVQNLRHGNYEIATNDASPAADSLSYSLSSPRQCDPPARTIRLPGHARRSDNATVRSEVLHRATRQPWLAPRPSNATPLRRLVEVWGEPRAELRPSGILGGGRAIRALSLGCAR